MSKIALSGNASGTGTLTIAAPNTNTDRTLTLPDNTGTVVTTASTGAVAQAMLETLVVPIGVGQTWTNVKASRATDTTYTNTTGRPIVVTASTTIATYAYIQAFIDGVQFINSRSRDADTTSSQASIYFIVPAGSTYKITVNVNAATTISVVDVWYELR